MRRQMMFHSLSCLETLDLRLSPSSMSVGASLAHPIISHSVAMDDDPLPNPDPSPARCHPSPSRPIRSPGSPRRVRLVPARPEIRAHARRLAGPEPVSPVMEETSSHRRRPTLSSRDTATSRRPGLTPDRDGMGMPSRAREPSTGWGHFRPDRVAIPPPHRDPIAAERGRRERRAPTWPCPLRVRPGRGGRPRGGREALSSRPVPIS